MNNAWPLWALPFWTMGIPLIWALVEKWRTPRPATSVKYESRATYQNVQLAAS
jgi:hypothetical protein